MPFELDMSSKNDEQPKPAPIKALKQQLAREIKARRAAEKRERTLRAELTKLQKRFEVFEANSDRPRKSHLRRRAEG